MLASLLLKHHTFIGIDVDYLVVQVHTQNGLAESFIKCLQLIARPLLMKSKLLTSVWGHAILHATSLVRIRPSAYHKYSPLQLVFGIPPNIFLQQTFSHAVYMPITDKRLKWVRNIEYEFMLVLILHLLLDSFNL